MYTANLEISIHALRVEGDAGFEMDLWAAVLFLSTPSGWRATLQMWRQKSEVTISIHALRVEGDPSNPRFTGGQD